MKTMFIIAGPNGSGKTTFALNALSKFLKVDEFANADEIAKGISPLKPESANIQAGRVMIERLNTLIESDKSFAFETTLSGRMHLKIIEKAKSKGYLVFLIFLWLPSAKIAIKRVKNCVKQGGHNIPVKTIRRRYKSGIKNLVNLYLDKVDEFRVINNFNPERKDSMIAKKLTGHEFEVYNEKIWNKILDHAKKD